MKIGEFQGVEMFLNGFDNQILNLTCYFNNKELNLLITNSTVEILSTNMDEAQAYYISNSLKDMYNELINDVGVKSI